MNEANRWKPLEGKLPEGVLRGWTALAAVGPLCGLFEVIDPRGEAGRSYILTYRFKGTRKAQQERFPDLGIAMRRANELMSGSQLEPDKKLH